MHIPKLLLLSAVLCSALPGQWLRVQDAGSPGPRSDPAMTYMPNLGATVMFGGLTSGFLGSGATWRYDGDSWTALAPVTSPEPRTHAPMVFDSQRNVAVLHGGRGTGVVGPLYGNTWEFDGTGWRLAATSQSPGIREAHGLAFDAARGVTVLYGGQAGGFNWPVETWEYDGVDWTQVPTANNPGARVRPAMCHHAALGVSVLFGGVRFTPPVGYDDETWIYDGTDWTQVAIVGPSPSPRQMAALVYDDVREVCLLVGGLDSSGQALADTWELDLASLAWRQLPALPGPPRRLFGFTFDAGRGVGVLFGGELASNFQPWAETYEFGANARSIGAGCGGQGGVPLHGTSAPPRLGSTLTLDTDNLNPATSAAVLTLGVAAQLTLLDGVGMPGCAAYVQPTSFETVIGSGGSASMTIVVPSAPVLVGAELFSQAFGLDPGVNALGLSASNALIVVAGL